MARMPQALGPDAAGPPWFEQADRSTADRRRPGSLPLFKGDARRRTFVVTFEGQCRIVSEEGKLRQSDRPAVVRSKDRRRLLERERLPV